ncbi:hypothetical protein GQ600_257 [Phytophthora cactorum]|nr:hypothetical protein GQ600_257 [Phytophthora cactorum]
MERAAVRCLRSRGRRRAHAVRHLGRVLRLPDYVTHQVFRKRSSTSAEARNTDLTKHGSVTPITVIPPSTLNHGWSRTSRSKGKREKYFMKSTKCGAQLSVTESGLVTQQVTAHNTPRPAHIREPPVQRRVEDVGVLDFVEELQAADYTTPQFTTMSVKKASHSTRRTFQTKEARRGSITVESRLDCCFREFALTKATRLRSTWTTRKLAQTIRFQTHQMRWFFEAFPEVMMSMPPATPTTLDTSFLAS